MNENPDGAKPQASTEVPSPDQPQRPQHAPLDALTRIYLIESHIDLPAGCEGTIVRVHQDGGAYDADFDPSRPPVTVPASKVRVFDPENPPIKPGTRFESWPARFERRIQAYKARSKT